jgi:hypothetical protein
MILADEQVHSGFAKNANCLEILFVVIWERFEQETVRDSDGIGGEQQHVSVWCRTPHDGSAKGPIGSGAILNDQCLVCDRAKMLSKDARRDIA